MSSTRETPETPARLQKNIPTQTQWLEGLTPSAHRSRAFLVFSPRDPGPLWHHRSRRRADTEGVQQVKPSSKNQVKCLQAPARECRNNLTRFLYLDPPRGVQWTTHTTYRLPLGTPWRVLVCKLQLIYIYMCFGDLVVSSWAQMDIGESYTQAHD